MKDQALTAYAKAAGETRRLIDRQYVDQKSVDEAGAIAKECGEAAREVANMDAFLPALDGVIRYQVGATSGQQARSGQACHLLNKFVEGFAEAGSIKTEADFLTCLRLLRNDDGWFRHAERALLRSAVSIPISPHTLIEACYFLISERAVTLLVTISSPEKGKVGK